MEGSAFITRAELTITTTMMWGLNAPIGPFVPPIVTEHVPAWPVDSCPKIILPKLARGTIPEVLDGASAIHSAEDLKAPLTRSDFETDALHFGPTDHSRTEGAALLLRFAAAIADLV